MDSTQLIALASPAAVVATAAVGALWRMLHARFKVLDVQIVNLGTELRELYEKHEERDQERHVENVDRFARLETKIAENGNGHKTPRRRRN